MGDIITVNYCASFIDLLGQRAALKGQNLNPIIESKKDQKNFQTIIKKSVGAIEQLQSFAMDFRKNYLKTENINYDSLNEEEKKIYELMKKDKPKQQRWSDGLVYYSPLGDPLGKGGIQCPMHSIYEIFTLSGALCLISIANKQPIRGAIEVSWGAELHQNELYGAVIANSYELESEVAQYPRIVVGKYAMGYMQVQYQAERDPDDNLGNYNKNLAKMCLDMISIDQDGYPILDYLHTFLTDANTKNVKEIIHKAYSFICEEYEKHVINQNSKLAIRYAWLKLYFDEKKQQFNI